MPLPTFDYTTGQATLSDDPLSPNVATGTLSYNGCVFSPLYITNVSGKAVKDEANRTVKYLECEIVADGYVTLPPGAASTSGVMGGLQTMLTAQGGALVYRGRGWDIVVNQAGTGGVKDVAWGPVPELLEFQPLGGGRAAKIVWRVTARIPAVKNILSSMPMVQFNYETAVNYGEDGYSTISMRGTLEIAVSRAPNQSTRTVPLTADNRRSEIESRLMSGIDLTRFRVTRREFTVSRDKRTMNWDIQAEERPYMDLPPGCTEARGRFRVRPQTAGMGMQSWLCSLQASYTVRGDQPRRIAWLAFLSLLRYRMMQSVINQATGKQGATIATPGYAAGQSIMTIYQQYLAQLRTSSKSAAFLMNFEADEGLYLDSKSSSFSATWMVLATGLDSILNASGMFVQLPPGSGSSNLWAMSMKDVEGVNSWLGNPVNPKLDVIVDLGSP